MEMQSMDDSSEKLKLVNERLDSVKQVMVQTIDNVIVRGEKLDNLVDKTEQLDSSAFNFHKNAKKLRNQMLCKKIKLYFCISFSIIFILWLLSCLICGFDYKKCN